MLRLTGPQATAAGWSLAQSPTGRTRLVSPEGVTYVPCRKARAEVALEAVTLPLRYFRRTEVPAQLLLAVRERDQTVTERQARIRREVGQIMRELEA